MSRFLAGAILGLLSPAAGDIAVCPGEGARYEDFKCDHDSTHRVCAKLLDAEGSPLDWGSKGNFWQITGQTAFQWDDEIRANHGDSWCICMWATARLISAAGCENVHLDCAATDVKYVMKSYADGGVDLEPAKTCLQQKCPEQADFQRLSDASMPVVDAGSTKLPAAKWHRRATVSGPRDDEIE
eukprot:TRINITY_DN16001_c0_g1_i1.p1 TRINITY_DN16001_c0_g1~~TRINITY_DN16001_c0_g1_i1.p1  ORF type:complete len:184 (+),score=37.66 TRINITY_DN16001_c0_g1_i1:71-622(+)